MPGPTPRWPARIGVLCHDLRLAVGEEARQSLRGELWLLLNMALLRYLTFHVPRLGRVAREDLEDIASQKALDLLSSAESGSWELSCREPAEVAAYLSAVARNGLVDHARRVGRLQPLGAVSREPESDASLVPEPRGGAEDPEAGAERREFVRALGECVSELNLRTRTIWFFRVFYEMATKEIAQHPEVGLKPGHVDVLLQRCRQIVRECMTRKGHSADELPPGTFLELWNSFRREAGAPGPPKEQTIDVRP